MSSGVNAEIRNYMRWEYGTPDAAWILRGTPRRRPRTPRARGWVIALRYWVNSFRGFAAFDVRGTDRRA